MVSGIRYLVALKSDEIPPLDALVAIVYSDCLTPDLVRKDRL